MSNLKRFEEAINDGSIRKTPDNEVAVIDVIQHLTGKDYRQAVNTFNWLKSRHLELFSFSQTYSFGVGRPSQVMAAQGIIQLLMILPGIKAAKFRQDAARLICRYLSADITLADEIIQANRDDSDAIKWIQARAKGVEARNHFTDAIKEHGGEGMVYAIATNKNNEAITGEPASQLKNPRDAFSMSELAGMLLAESLEADQMDIKNVNGNEGILDVVDEIAPQVGALVRKLGRKELVAEGETVQ